MKRFLPALFVATVCFAIEPPPSRVYETMKIEDVITLEEQNHAKKVTLTINQTVAPAIIIRLFVVKESGEGMRHFKLIELTAEQRNQTGLKIEHVFHTGRCRITQTIVEELRAVDFKVEYPSNN